MAKRSSKPGSGSNGSALGLEATLWATAEKLRSGLSEKQLEKLDLAGFAGEWPPLEGPRQWIES